MFARSARNKAIHSRSSYLRGMSNISIVPSSRLDSLVKEKNVFAEFTALSMEYKACNLGQGFPSFGSPSFLTSIMSEISNGDVHRDPKSPPENLNNQYCKPGEEASLAGVLASRYSSRMCRTLDPSNICTTVGAQEALFTTFASFCNEGDEMITITPAFDSYFKSAAVLGLNVKAVPLIPGAESNSTKDVKLDISSLRKCLSEKTKILLLNTPSSPFGKVFSKDELQEIADVVKEYPNLLVVSDEVYESMTFKGTEHVHISSLPDMFDRTISIFSAGKTFSCTGWRVGYAIGPTSLIQNIKTMHSVINFSTTTPLQKAVAKAFYEAEACDYFTWLPQFLEEKRNKFCGALDDIGMKYILPEGGIFVVADISNFFAKAGIDKARFDALTAETPLDDRPDVQFSRWLVKEIGVGPIPMSPFYIPDQRYLANNYIRLAYCKDDKTLDLAIERLKRLA